MKILVQRCRTSWSPSTLKHLPGTSKAIFVAFYVGLVELKRTTFPNMDEAKFLILKTQTSQFFPLFCVFWGIMKAPWCGFKTPNMALAPTWKPCWWMENPPCFNLRSFHRGKFVRIQTLCSFFEAPFFQGTMAVDINSFMYEVVVFWWG